MKTYETVLEALKTLQLITTTTTLTTIFKGQSQEIISLLATTPVAPQTGVSANPETTHLILKLLLITSPKKLGDNFHWLLLSFP